MSETEKKSSVSDAIRVAVQLFGKRSISYVLLITMGRVLAGFVDLVGVALLSAFSAAALNEASNSQVDIPGISGSLLEFDVSPLKLLFAALILLTFKSALSFFLSVVLTKTLNLKVARLIKDFSERVAHADKDWTDQFSTQELHYLLTAGIRAATSGVINPVSTIIAETALLSFFLVFLITTNWVASLLCLAILGASSYSLYRILSKRQYRIGQLTGSANITSMAIFQETIHGYRELLVRGTLVKHTNKFSNIESDVSKLLTRQAVLGLLPRHVLETIVIASLGAVAIVVSAGNSTKESLLLLTIFAATTARILPSLLPLQAAFAEVQTNMGLSERFIGAFNFISPDSGKAKNDIGSNGEKGIDRTPRISCRNISYRYPHSTQNALSKISFDFEGVGWFAIDGPSGSGKSTLFDILLGIKHPVNGTVSLNGMTPREFLDVYPGICAYLPQRITTSHSSIAENVAFGEVPVDINVELVEELLIRVGLADLIDRSPKGIWDTIGELGRSVSGGQLQRLGIARCLYTSPAVLLLDESTTGLDDASQEDILNLFSELSREVQIISISHDRKIVNRASKVILLDQGHII